MSATLLDGKKLAEAMRAEIAADAAAFAHRHGTTPGLAAVLVGDDPASQVYVRNKRTACEKTGLASWLHHLPKDTTQAQLLDRRRPVAEAHPRDARAQLGEGAEQRHLVEPPGRCGLHREKHTPHARNEA